MSAHAVGRLGTLLTGSVLAPNHLTCPSLTRNLEKFLCRNRHQSVARQFCQFWSEEKTHQSMSCTPPSLFRTL